MTMNPTSTSLSLGLQKLKIRLEYYNEQERKKLSSYPSATKLDELCGSDIEIKYADFLQLLLFHKLKIGAKGYKRFEELSQKIRFAESMLDGSIDHENESIRIITSTGTLNTETVEHLGESIGLCVLNLIHGLNPGDWHHIQTSKTKTLDFENASDSKRIIQLETKGRVTSGSGTKEGLSDAKADISKKKSTQRVLAQGTNTSALLYGTICAFDSRTDSYAKCYLTDPPPYDFDLEPQLHRIVARLSFIKSWISILFPKSQIIGALGTRINDLLHIQSADILSNVRLDVGEESDFTLDAELKLFDDSATRHQTRSTTAGSVGHTFQLSNDRLFYIGIREGLLEMAIDQDFEKIVKYKTVPSSKIEKVRCVLPAKRHASIFGKSEKLRRVSYVSFIRYGVIHTSSSGIVFGVVSIT